jgi:hypothetical protein
MVNKSTKITTSHLKSQNIEQAMTYPDGNSTSDLGHVQNYGRVKHAKGVTSLALRFDLI